MYMPWCVRRNQGTTLGVVLTFHFISGQSLSVICHWDVEARLASLQAPGNSRLSPISPQEHWGYIRALRSSPTWAPGIWTQALVFAEASAWCPLKHLCWVSLSSLFLGPALLELPHRLAKGQSHRKASPRTLKEGSSEPLLITAWSGTFHVPLTC